MVESPFLPALPALPNLPTFGAPLSLTTAEATQIAVFFCSFLIYSLTGWLFEFVYCSIKEGRFTNRGFFNGPWCPIYGAGAMLAVLLFGSMADPLAVFVLSGVVCCTMEYATSWALEKRYHARWWDYSHRAFNLGGRICLAGGLLFGAACTGVVFFFQPAIDTALGALEPAPLCLGAGVLLGIFITDVAITLMGVSALREKIDALCDQATSGAQSFAIAARLAATIKLTDQERRLLEAYPWLEASREAYRARAAQVRETSAAARARATEAATTIRERMGR